MGRKFDAEVAALWEQLDGPQREALDALCDGRKVRQVPEQRHYDALQKLRLVDHFYELLPLGRRVGAYGKAQGDAA